MFYPGPTQTFTPLTISPLSYADTRLYYELYGETKDVGTRAEDYSPY